MKPGDRSRRSRIALRAPLIAGACLLSAIGIAGARVTRRAPISVPPNPTVCYVVDGVIVCTPTTVPDSVVVR